MSEGVLLMAYGAPARLDQVEAYYTDIRGGTAPPPALLRELTSRYRAIGGGSPLSRVVERQRAALEAELARRGRPARVYAGMKHIAPFIRDAVARMAEDGVGRAAAIALAPQHSTFNVWTYGAMIEKAAAALGARAPRFEVVGSWHAQPRLIDALAAATAEALARCADPSTAHVFFTAHSLPVRLASGTDPYVREVLATASLVAERLGLARCDVAFQSAGRTGDEWVGPDLRDEIRRVTAAGVREIVVCPVGFVADHLEVLYDVDIEARAVAAEHGARLERARAMNDDPRFIAALADVALAGLGPVDASASAPVPIGSVRPARFVYGRAPMLLYWELTRACGLACRHCRAEAIPARDPLELGTAECLAVLDRIREFGQPLPHVVFTGGDPLRRPDLITLIAAATARGIGASLAPSATVDLTPEVLRAVRAAGARAISLSLDGSSAERHDTFRGVPGTFDATLRATRDARAAGLAVQINTLVTADTVDDLEAIARLLTPLDVMRWSLFFLIRVGRGSGLREVSPARTERLFRWLLDLAERVPFQVKTTEAMHYRRVAVRRMEAAGLDPAAIGRTPVGRGFGVRDGNGIAFIAHDGAVYPSGFLPLDAGNVRASSIVDIYRSSQVFASLRDADALTGKCGRCAYRLICGGSRARAYASAGDPLASDPLCPYEPPPASAVWGVAG
ncbi:MAG TPA: TIGR04053 family radical SAM/SPASM domain-containing protein [Candidatus Limnocylindria bacterium]|nr:TIGR04053 family radical SAM/SPASM domain-containing protein [Candidatus Limnocylindria bacterium]